MLLCYIIFVSDVLVVFCLFPNTFSHRHLVDFNQKLVKPSEMSDPWDILAGCQFVIHRVN